MWVSLEEWKAPQMDCSCESSNTIPTVLCTNNGLICGYITSICSDKFSYHVSHGICRNPGILWLLASIISVNYFMIIYAADDSNVTLLATTKLKPSVNNSHKIHKPPFWWVIACYDKKVVKQKMEVLVFVVYHEIFVSQFYQFWSASY